MRKTSPIRQRQPSPGKFDLPNVQDVSSVNILDELEDTVVSCSLISELHKREQTTVRYQVTTCLL